MSYLEKFGNRDYAIQNISIILIVVRFSVRIHYRPANTFFSMQYCATMHSSDDDARSSISRRMFLGSTALVVLPTLCGGCTSNAPALIDLPAVTNNAIAIPLGEFAELAAVGGSIVGKAPGHAGPIAIAHVDNGTFVAIDATCTHMQCTVDYNALNRTFDCPCHDSTYEVDGRVIGGPAVRPLKTFTATASSDGATLLITLA